MEAEHLVPGGPPAMSEADWQAKAAQWFLGVVDAGLGQVSWPLTEPHLNYIHEQVKKNVRWP